MQQLSEHPVIGTQGKISDGQPLSVIARRGVIHITCPGIIRAVHHHDNQRIIDIVIGYSRNFHSVLPTFVIVAADMGSVAEKSVQRSLRTGTVCFVFRNDIHRIDIEKVAERLVRLFGEEMFHRLAHSPVVGAVGDQAVAERIAQQYDIDAVPPGRRLERRHFAVFRIIRRFVHTRPARMIG